MALNQNNKLVWIVETIYNAQKISFKDLNRKWMDNVDFSGGEELLKRTFHKWKSAIFDTFGLIIECEKVAPYRYYIANVEDLKQDGFSNWLLNTISVSNFLAESKSIKDRIILEDVPSGREYLEPVIDAMKKNRFIHITYYNYWREDEKEYCLMPLCVKLFRQRWYMVGRTCLTNRDIVLCLDRFRDFRMSIHTFVYPKDFNPQEYFDGCYGIIADKEYDIEDVLLKVSSGQANYLRDLPMMPDQQEIERNDGYSIFKLRVRPSYDFQQELLWNREELEVLEPQWLREDITGLIQKMLNKYKKEEK